MQKKQIKKPIIIEKSERKHKSTPYVVEVTQEGKFMKPDGSFSIVQISESFCKNPEEQEIRYQEMIRIYHKGEQVKCQVFESH